MAYDCRDNRKAIFNRGVTPNINPNSRGRKTPKQGRKPLLVFTWEDTVARCLASIASVTCTTHARPLLAR